MVATRAIASLGRAERASVSRDFMGVLSRLLSVAGDCPCDASEAPDRRSSSTQDSHPLRAASPGWHPPRATAQAPTSLGGLGKYRHNLTLPPTSLDQILMNLPHIPNLCRSSTVLSAWSARGRDRWNASP